MSSILLDNVATITVDQACLARYLSAVDIVLKDSILEDPRIDVIQFIEDGLAIKYALLGWLESSYALPTVPIKLDPPTLDTVAFGPGGKPDPNVDYSDYPDSVWDEDDA